MINALQIKVIVVAKYACLHLRACSAKVALMTCTACLEYH